MNFKKLVQIVNYVLKKYDNRLNYTKLIKILYIADRECLSRWDFAISEDSYASMDQGVVLSGLYDFIRGRISDSRQIEWQNYFYKEGYDLVAKIGNEPSCDELSDIEKDIIDEVDSKYHSNDWTYLVDEVVHKFPEWVEVKEQVKETSLPLKKEKILSVLGRKEEEIKKIIALENNCSSIEKKLKE